MRFLRTDVWVRRLRGAILILVFIFVFLYIFSLNFRTPTRMDLLQRFITEIVSPPIQLFDRVLGVLDKLCKDYLWLKNLRGENESLRKEVAELQGKVTSYQEAYVENQRLRRLLDFKSSTTAELIPAQVVAHDLTGWFQTLMIDKGFRDGVVTDMPVVNDEGVIGRIFDTSDHHSRVLLLTDQGSAVDAIDQRNRVRGILCGKDANGCILKYVRGNLDIKEGDLIITSGKDGIYPKGLRLGIVHAVFKDPLDLFQKIEIKPLVRLSALEELLVIKRGGVGMGVEEEGQSSEAQPAAQSPSQPNPAQQPQAGVAAKPAVKPPVKPSARPPTPAASKAKAVSKPSIKPQVQTGAMPKPQIQAPARPQAQTGSAPKAQIQPGAKPKPQIQPGAAPKPESHMKLQNKPREKPLQPEHQDQGKVNPKVE